MKGSSLPNGCEGGRPSPLSPYSDAPGPDRTGPGTVGAFRRGWSALQRLSLKQLWGLWILGALLALWLWLKN